MIAEGAFIEETDRPLESRFFPSKIGGPPAWLNLEHIPSVSEIQCDFCGLPRNFLCQLYSPVEGKDSACHRTVFVFICLSEKCFEAGSNKNFIVFRNQLPLNNSYYPDTPVGIELRTDITCDKFGTNVCSVCGIRGDLQCERCKERFCTVHHQKLHIKHSQSVNSPCAQNYEILLPEYGLSDPEGLTDIASDDSNPDQEEQLHDDEAVAEICQKMTQFKSLQDDATLEEIFKTCSETSHDSTFLKFKAQISVFPDLVLRYCRNNPLWLSDQHQPSDDSIPPCEYCDGPREFEFQILPQLLNYLHLDHGENLKSGVLDWGTLAVYTCKNSCDDGPPYKKEFLWKQDLL